MTILAARLADCSFLDDCPLLTQSFCESDSKCLESHDVRKIKQK